MKPCFAIENIPNEMHTTRHGEHQNNENGRKSEIQGSTVKQTLTVISGARFVCA